MGYFDLTEKMAAGALAGIVFIGAAYEIKNSPKYPFRAPTSTEQPQDPVTLELRKEAFNLIDRICAFYDFDKSTGLDNSEKRKLLNGLEPLLDRKITMDLNGPLAIELTRNGTGFNITQGSYLGTIGYSNFKKHLSDLENSKEEPGKKKK